MRAKLEALLNQPVRAIIGGFNHKGTLHEIVGAGPVPEGLVIGDLLIPYHALTGITAPKE